MVYKKIGNERQAEASDQGIEKVAQSRANTHEESLPKAFLYGFLDTQNGNRPDRTGRQKANYNASI